MTYIISILAIISRACNRDAPALLYPKKILDIVHYSPHADIIINSDILAGTGRLLWRQTGCFEVLNEAVHYLAASYIL